MRIMGRKEKRKVGPLFGVGCVQVEREREREREWPTVFPNGGFPNEP
jgi:hypothetical protein